MMMPYRSGAKVHTAVADVRDYDALAKAMEETKEKLGPVHTVCATPAGRRSACDLLRVASDGLTWIRRNRDGAALPSARRRGSGQFYLLGRENVCQRLQIWYDHATKLNSQRIRSVSEYALPRSGGHRPSWLFPREQGRSAATEGDQGKGEWS
jgi:hypothetical protein